MLFLQNIRSVANVPFLSFNRWAARSKTTLQSLNITHILNAADGPYSINTGAKYYADLQIEYYGIEAFDDPSFDLSIFFYDAANFIGKALNSPGGKREAMISFGRKFQHKPNDFSLQ